MSTTPELIRRDLDAQAVRFIAELNTIRRELAAMRSTLDRINALLDLDGRDPDGR